MEKLSVRNIRIDYGVFFEEEAPESVIGAEFIGCYILMTESRKIATCNLRCWNILLDTTLVNVEKCYFFARRFLAERIGSSIV